MLLHGIQVEGAMLAMSGGDLLGNVVVKLAGGEVHVTVNGKVDMDCNKDVVHSFLSNWKKLWSETALMVVILNGVLTK